jgi:DNA-binding response OmpR family regulator
MKVLVVESDADLRALIESVIGAEHSVRAFTCGSGALPSLLAAPPDLLLLDLDPGDASCEDLARVAAALRPAPRIVLMSVDHQRLERSGSMAHARVPKPFAIWELAEALGTSY